MPFILDKFPTYESFAQARLTDIYPAAMLNNSVHKKISTMSSVYLRNDRNGNFTAFELPLLAQAGPIKTFYAEDINQDGHLDFIYAGNHFPTEVETARYDGLYKGICFGDGKGQFSCQPIFTEGQLPIEDVRSVAKINIGGKSGYLIAQNKGPLTLIFF
jgi:hypothetical protein